MNFGIILGTKEYEKAWNAFRFATTAKKNGHVVRVFLMGDAVECEYISHDQYNVAGQLKTFLEAGGTILACETCLKSRQMNSSNVCPHSTMDA
jgi:uncharacterized protein involved in oxidation of intracellular sulfur